MTRSTFGGTLYDIVASPTDAEDITSPLALVPSVEVPLYDSVGGVLQTDFLLWSTIDGAFTVEATAIETDASGYLPLFQGPDGVEVLYDAGGRMFRSHEMGGGGVSSWDDLIGKPTTFTPSTHNHTIAQVVGLQGFLDSKVDGDSLEEELDSWADASGRPPVLVIGAADPLPAVQNGAILLRLGGAATGSLTPSLVLSEALGSVAANTATSTGATPAALGAGAVCLAAVAAYQSAGTSGDPAPVPTNFQAMGLTWTAIDLPSSNVANGLDSFRLYLGKGTGTTAKPTVTYGEAVQAVHISVTQIQNATGTVVQASSAQQANTVTTPSVTLPSPVGGNGIVMTWIVQNNNTNAQTPGTGYTELGSALSSTGIRTSRAYSAPGAQTASWTVPSGYAKLVVAAEVR